MPLRILVVDDNIVARSLLREFFDILGHEVVAEAATLPETESAYRTHAPDLVTLDLSLPTTDGLDVLKALLAIDGKARVLVISANSQQLVRDAVLAAGAVGFVTKPVSIAEMKAALAGLPPA